MASLRSHLRAFPRASLCHAALVSALACCACSAGDETDTGTPKQGEEQPAGAQISDAEFAAVALPSIQVFLNSYESVTRSTPAAATTDAALSRLIFDQIKTQPPMPGIDSEHVLSRQEFILAVLNPRISYQAFSIAPVAESAAIAAFPCDAPSSYVNGKADAARHAFWMAQMASTLGSLFALGIGIAHEADSLDPSASRMDLHNNLAGIALATRYPSASTQELLELVLTQPMRAVTSAEVDAVPSDTLVYYLGAAAYDGTLAGSVSDAESGADPVTLSITQCDTVVRGQLVRERGSERQVRRFRGVVSEGSVDITFDDPRPFESRLVRPECLAMRANLSGDAAQLSGRWTSPTCADGGVLSLARPRQ